MVIAGLGHSSGPASSNLLGIAWAFTVDALSFVVSVLTLWRISVSRVETSSTPLAVNHVLADIRSGLAFAWNDPFLRLLFIVTTVLNFCFVGPIEVGIPVLAHARLPEDAAAFGIIMSAFAGGNLVGILLAGTLRQRKGLHIVVTAAVSMFGIGVAIFGFVSNTWLAALLFLVMGVGNGYVGIILITFLQRRTPSAMLGRMMSLVALANVGLGPVSQALSGAVVKIGISLLFVGAGVPILLTTMWMALQPALKLLYELNAQTAGTEATTKMQLSPGE
jgi:MFS family permease